MRYRWLFSSLILTLVASFFSSSSALANDLRIQKDLTGDGNPETIVVREMFDENTPPEITYREAMETSVSILEPDNSVAVEARVPNGRPKVEFVSLPADGTKQLAVWTEGGAHYTNLTILDYRNGELEKLFANGSACEVTGEFKSTPPTIRVGRANWADPEWNYASGERLWNVYTWNGKTFVFDERKSTVRERSEEEEVTGYVGEVMKDAAQR